MSSIDCYTFPLADTTPTSVTSLLATCKYRLGRQGLLPPLHLGQFGGVGGGHRRWWRLGWHAPESGVADYCAERDQGDGDEEAGLVSVQEGPGRGGPVVQGYALAG